MEKNKFRTVNRIKGIRPQDIVVLLKIVSIKHDIWNQANLAQALKMSIAEISEALNRSKAVGLVDSKKRTVNIYSLIEFLIYGLKYVFPAEPGEVVKGIPTAHSASPVKDRLLKDTYFYVWPYEKGTMRGQAIEPLHKSVPLIVKEDIYFYELLTLVDALRIGREREIPVATDELKKRLSKYK